MTRLTSDRLILRRTAAGDLMDIHALYGDVETMNFWSSAPDPDIATSQKRLDGLIASPSPLTYFAAEHRGRVIGNIGVHERDEIGFIFHSDVWRQGFLTEACGLLFPYFFETLGFEQLTADADPLNTASCGALAHLGFQETGRARNTFCVDGQWSDSVYFCLTADAWRRSLT